MRKISLFILIIISMSIMFGCGGTKQLSKVEAGDIPDWFVDIPEDPNYLFATNSATSQDMQLAMDKAITAARAEIGRQVDIRIKGMQKRFDEEVGMDEDSELLQQFTQATKTVVSTSLSGSRVAKQKPVQDGNMWRAYVLVSYPIGAANEALMKQIAKSNNMYTRFRSSEAFKELEEEVKKFEEWKEKQGLQY